MPYEKDRTQLFTEYPSESETKGSIESIFCIGLCLAIAIVIASHTFKF
jgi:hypothetical protein